MRSLYLNIDLLGHFAGKFARYHICLRVPIVVDSSSVLPLLGLDCKRLHRLVPRGHWDYSIVLSTPLTLLWTCEAALSRLYIILTITCKTLRLQGKAAQTIKATNLVAD